MKTNQRTTAITRPSQRFVQHWKVEFADSIPPVAEIAHLAAIMTKGKSSNFNQAARRAIDLWTACREQRDEWIYECGIAEMDRTKKHWDLTSGKMPTKYPVTLDDFLRLALPKERREWRIKCFREFIRARLHINRRWHPQGLLPIKNVPAPSDKECDQEIKRQYGVGFGEFETVRDFASFVDFASWWRAENLKKRATAGRRAQGG